MMTFKIKTFFIQDEKYCQNRLQSGSTDQLSWAHHHQAQSRLSISFSLGSFEFRHPLPISPLSSHQIQSTFIMDYNHSETGFLIIIKIIIIYYSKIIVIIIIVCNWLIQNLLEKLKNVYLF